MTGPQDPRYPGPSDPQQPGQQPPGQHPQPPGQYPPPPGQYPPPPGQYPPPYGAPPPGEQYPTQQFPTPYGQYPTPYGTPGYGTPQPYPGRPPAPRTGFWQRLGDRVHIRPAPRLGVSVVGVGVGLVVLGILVWGGTYVVEGQVAAFGSGSSGPSSDSRHFLGFALALILVAVGYALIVKVRSGPLVTAGVAATALGIPVAMEFLTLDLTGGDLINIDAVVWVSIIAYLLTYLFVRSARGHAFYLGLALLLLWDYVLFQAGPSTASLSRDAGGFFGGGSSGNLDTGTLAGLSLIFGIGYYLLAWYFDRSGRHGVAIAFVAVGLPAVLLGIGALAPHTKQIGTGLILLVVGLAISRYAARYDR
ncbi:MAG: hypothetical protein ACRDVG_05390, partial [Jatrophihabitantaceae bacterium]